jgi:Kef-type K+ transport system membrane component KefB
LNLKSIEWGSPFIWVLTALLFIVAALGKALSGFLLIKETLKTKLIVGTAMIPRGEVGLIFANVGLTAGVLSNDIYTALILVIAFTTLLAPLALRSLCTTAHPG